jgi:hypothetical protein
MNRSDHYYLDSLGEAYTAVFGSLGHMPSTTKMVAFRLPRTEQLRWMNSADLPMNLPASRPNMMLH